ncbi:hypothetical protein ABTZ46_29550, partial [Nocardioides sp. NPDC126508]
TIRLSTERRSSVTLHSRSSTMTVTHHQTISHHLKVLRQAGLLDCERRGTWVYYWVIPAALQQLSAVLLVEASSTAADVPQETAV